VWNEGWRRAEVVGTVNSGSSPVMGGSHLLLMSDYFSVLGLTDIFFLLSGAF